MSGIEKVLKNQRSRILNLREQKFDIERKLADAKKSIEHCANELKSNKELVTKLKEREMKYTTAILAKDEEINELLEGCRLYNGTIKLQEELSSEIKRLTEENKKLKEENTILRNEVVELNNKRQSEADNCDKESNIDILQDQNHRNLTTNNVQSIELKNGLINSQNLQNKNHSATVNSRKEKQEMSSVFRLAGLYVLSEEERKNRLRAVETSGDIIDLCKDDSELSGCEDFLGFKP